MALPAISDSEKRIAMGVGLAIGFMLQIVVYGIFGHFFGVVVKSCTIRDWIDVVDLGSAVLFVAFIVLPEKWRRKISWSEKTDIIIASTLASIVIFGVIISWLLYSGGVQFVVCDESLLYPSQADRLAKLGN